MLAAALFAFSGIAAAMAGSAPAARAGPPPAPAMAADAGPAAPAMAADAGPAAGVPPPPEPLPDAVVFRSKRGGIKVLCAGHSYRFARYLKTGAAVFRCDKSELLRCPARAEGVLNGDTVTSFTVKADHAGHLAEPERSGGR